MKVKDLIEYLNELPEESEIEFICKNGKYEKIDIQWNKNELDMPYIYLDDIKPIWL